jgi:hypothetical protein
LLEVIAEKEVRVQPATVRCERHQREWMNLWGLVQRGFACFTNAVSKKNDFFPGK